jgi:hypothetical protein
MSTEMATFETLIDLPPYERVRRLDEIRADAAETATRLERMLGLIAEDLAELDAAADDPRLGTTVGGWTLERRIGEGSSSIVYLGRDDSGAAVAVKILRLDHLSESTRRRFEREIAAHARLDHPGFARLLASDLAATPPWLATEWVEDGRAITDWASLHAPSIDERVALIDQLRAALGAAREAGVVHRDLSPNNVLVDRHGRVKIVDLGIARLLEDDEGFSRLSRTGRHAIGTPAYMAPEQIDPSFGPIGPWTDEYAVALIAYRLLTGKLPYDTSGSFASVAQAIVHVPVAMGEIDRSILPESLVAWIELGLAKSVSERTNPDRRIVAVDSLPASGPPGSLGSNSWRRRITLGFCVLAVAVTASIRAVSNQHAGADDSGDQEGETDMRTSGQQAGGQAAVIAALGGAILAPADTAVARGQTPDIWITIADSNKDFSSTQGLNGWRYLFDRGNGTAIQPMTHFLPNGYDGPIWTTAPEFGMPENITWCMLRNDACHPNSGFSCGTNGVERPIREWTAPVPMMVRLRLETAIEACSGGLRIDFLVDGSVVDSYQHGPGGPLQISKTIETPVQQAIAVRVDALAWCNCDFLPEHRITILGLDCDSNGVADEVDIANGAPDVNGNGAPDTCECFADLDVSGVVNSVDLAIILAAWGTNGGKYPQADIDGSGTVDATDLSQVLAGWGSCPQ